MNFLAELFLVLIFMGIPSPSVYAIVPLPSALGDQPQTWLEGVGLFCEVIGWAVLIAACVLAMTFLIRLLMTSLTRNVGDNQFRAIPGSHPKRTTYNRDSHA